MRAFDQIEKRASKAQAMLAKASAMGARDQTKAADQAARAQIRGQDLVAKQGRKAADEWTRSLIQTGRVAERELARQARAQARAQTQAGRRFAQNVSHRTTRFLTPNAPLGSIASHAARDVARGLGIDFSLGSGLQRNRDIEQRATDLANAGFMRGAKGPAGARQDPRTIVEEARTAATAGGLAPDAAAAGLQSFVAKTGDLATGRAVLGDMAKLSKATGANMDDMVAAAGDVAATFGDVAESQQEAARRAEIIRDIMRVIAGQGKLGAVEVKDLASQMAKVSTSATAFTGDRSRNIATMGALAQMSRQRGGAATANIAATSVASFVNTLRTPARAGAFEAAGVKLEAGGGKFRDPQEIIIDAIKAAGSDTGKFKGMFANVQGARAVEGFRQIFLEAGGGGAGEEAVRKKFGELGGGAAITGEEEAKSLALALDTTSSKAQLFQNRLDEITAKVAGKLLPALEEAGPGLLKFAEIVGQVSTWVVDNPKKAIAGAIAASFARAGIESVLRAGLERMILGPTGGGGGVGGGRGAKVGNLAGNLGAAGTIASLAVTTLVVGMATIDHLIDRTKAEEAKRFRSNIDSANKEEQVRSLLRKGKVEEAAKLQGESVKDREKNLSATEGAQPGFFQKLTEFQLSPLIKLVEFLDPATKGGLDARDQANKQVLSDQKAELTASRSALQQIQNTLSGGININNFPSEGGDGREPQ